VKLTFLTKDKATVEALKLEPMIFRPEGEPQQLMPKGKRFGGDELNELLGCRTIDVVNLENGLYIIVDGENKLNGQPYNHLATSFWLTIQPHIKGWDYVAGPAIICARKFLSK